MHFAGVPSLGDVVDVELYIISAWILLFNLYVQLFFFSCCILLVLFSCVFFFDEVSHFSLSFSCNRVMRAFCSCDLCNCNLL